MNRPSLVAGAVAALLTVSLAASAKLTSVGQSDIKFLAVGPAGMKINGKSDDLAVEEKDGKLVFTAALTDLKTGIGLRDKHLRGYLKTDQHPNAKLVVDKGKLKTPDEGKTNNGNAAGQFTLNGVTKPVKFSYRARRNGNDYDVQGLTQIDIRDFKVEVPCYLGVCVEPTVKIKVKFKLRDK